jgi:PAS domain S-box-containing protein
MSVRRRVIPAQEHSGGAKAGADGDGYGPRLLAAIVDSFDDAIVSMTLDGVITTWNKAAERAYGYPADEVVGQSISILIPGDRRNEMAGILDRIRQGERADDYKTIRRIKAGTDLAVSLTVSPIRKSDDEIIGAWSIARNITEREREADEARSASRYARSLIEASLDPLVTISPEGTITDVNEATVQVTGVTREQLIGTDFSDYFTEPDRARAGYQQVFARGFVTDYPLTIRHVNGDLAEVLYNASVYKDAARNVLGVFAAARDVTAQKHASDYARSLIEASPDPLVTISPEGTITDVNEATVRVTGVTREQLIGTDFSDYFTEPDRARAGYQQVFARGFVTDYPLTIHNGKLTPVLYNASVYRDRAGEVRGVFAAARDVTAQRQAEAQIARTTDLLNLTQEISKTGGWEYDVASDRLTWTDEVYSIYGIEKTTGPVDISAAVASFDAESAPIIDAAFKRLVAQAEPYDLEVRLIRGDGRRIWVRTSGRAVIEDGQVVRATGNIIDITDRKDAEIQLRRAADEIRSLNATLEQQVQQRTIHLERANQSLEAFSYSVAHDLRTPLRGISGFAEALAEDYGDRLDQTGREYAARVQAGCARMATLIDDLLHLSRVTRAEMKLQDVDLSAEVTAICDQLRAGDPGRRVRVTVQDGVRVTADRPLIRDVLENLLGNAWKFTSHRDGAAIEFATTPVEDAPVCCCVRDNGAGFDPAYTGKLFRPFQRLHDASEFPGTGIGLASVRRIIERHGGRTWAEGAVDGGATIYFTLNTEGTL